VKRVAVLTLIRGLPGSGKTTLAKTISAVNFEADMYFTDEKGRYQFEGKNLAQAHNWCELQCDNALKAGQNVVISNTFVKHWEMVAYKEMAKKYKAELVIITCAGNYQNTHNVPQTVINKMKKQWQE
jgi:predicted kinase